MTCAANGGCPDILIVTCPHCGSMMWNEKWFTYEYFLARLPITPDCDRCTCHTVAGAFAARIRNNPGLHGVVGGEVFLGDPVLAFTALAVDDRDLVRRPPGLDSTGEPASHPHQVVVVQLLLAAVVQPSPPHP